MMKMEVLLPRRILFFVLTASLLITSCKKDEEEENDLVGTWVSTTSNFTAMVGTRTLTQYFIESMGLTASDAQLYTNLFNLTMQQSFQGTVQFNADRTYTSTLGQQSDSGTWSLNSTGSDLTIDSNTGDAVTFAVMKLTPNELQLHWVDNVNEDINGDNVNEPIAIDATVSFTKQ